MGDSMRYAAAMESQSRLTLDAIYFALAVDAHVYISKRRSRRGYGAPADQIDEGLADGIAWPSAKDISTAQPIIEASGRLSALGLRTLKVRARQVLSERRGGWVAVGMKTSQSARDAKRVHDQAIEVVQRALHGDPPPRQRQALSGAEFALLLAIGKKNMVYPPLDVRVRQALMLAFPTDAFEQTASLLMRQGLLHELDGEQPWAIRDLTLTSGGKATLRDTWAEHTNLAR